MTTETLNISEEQLVDYSKALHEPFLDDRQS